jgi:hypothetical protein
MWFDRTAVILGDVYDPRWQVWHIVLLWTYMNGKKYFETEYLADKNEHD